MPNNNFSLALDMVLTSEGAKSRNKGNVDHPDDEGGRTGQGITQTEYDRYRARKGKPRQDVWLMLDEERDEIYQDNYWYPMNLDMVKRAAVSYLVFDSAVLHGVDWTRKAVQKAVHVKADGVIGPMTLAALNAIDVKTFLDRMHDLRWARMQSKKSFPTFQAGWAKRLADARKNVLKVNKNLGEDVDIALPVTENLFDPFDRAKARC